MDTLDPTIVAAAAAHTATRTAAETAELLAGIALLDKLAKELAPMIALAGTRQEVRRRCHIDKADDKVRRTTYRALGLSDTRVGPGQDGGRDDHGGRYDGTDLLLTETGTWIELVYSGQWSRRQGALDSWRAVERKMTVEEVSAEYDIEKALRLAAAWATPERLKEIQNKTEVINATTARLRAAAEALGK